MPRSALIALALMVTACLARSPRGYPLYAGPQGPLDRVAILTGYVGWVDGRDVERLGGVFELLPGCHIIQTPAKWARGGNYGALVATTGTLTFALWVTAGHRYSVDVEADMPTGPVGPAFVRAQEMTREGDPLRSFGPVRDPAEVQNCWEHLGATSGQAP